MNQEEEKLEPEELRFSWRRPYYYCGPHPFIPKIYDGLSHAVPQGFNTVKITLDGTSNSSLDWQPAHEQAAEKISQGYKIFWEIDLGLFQGLKFPLGNETQYRTLCLALDHFRQTLWKTFHPHTFGLCLYRGPGDFYTNFKWDAEQLENWQGWLKDHFHTPEHLSQELGITIPSFEAASLESLGNHPLGIQLLQAFCRNASVAYMEFLLGSLPDALQSFILLDTTAITSPLEYAQTVNSQLFERFQLGINAPLFSHEQLHWGASFSSTGFLSETSHPPSEMVLEKPSLGICWPGEEWIKPSLFAPFESLLTDILSAKQLFRIIPEAHLTAEWEGIDYLIVLPETIHLHAKRKLLGFCAAGGTVVNAGKSPLGLPLEIPLESWMSTLTTRLHSD